MRESREDGGTARREGVYLVVAAEEDSAVKNVLKRMRVEYVDVNKKGMKSMASFFGAAKPKATSKKLKK